MAKTLTGPASKGAHSGGKTFTPKVSHRPGGMGNFTNGTSDAERTIKGLKYNGDKSWGTPNSESLKRKPGK